MEKLGWRVNDGEPERRGTLGDRTKDIEVAYENAAKALPPERALWDGAALIPEVVAVMDAIEHMAEWKRSHIVSRRTHAALVVDFSIGRMPEHLRVPKRKQWMELREFFADVAHHRKIERRQQTLSDVAERFRELEDFLYARWAPQTVRDFAEIDALIEPGGH